MTVEERLSALESALAAIRAADEPSGYYTSKYTGEEIDTAIDKISGGLVIIDGTTKKKYTLIIESGVLKIQEA